MGNNSQVVTKADDVGGEDDAVDDTLPTDYQP